MEMIKLHKGTLVAFSEGAWKRINILNLCCQQLVSQQNSPIAEVKHLVQDTNLQENSCGGGQLIYNINIGSYPWQTWSHCEICLICYRKPWNFNPILLDLLICDIGLPDGSGLDVVKEMKAKKSSIESNCTFWICYHTRFSEKPKSRL